MRTYWIVHRVMQTNGWTDETVWKCLEGESLLQVTPEGEEPFYCLGTYNTSKLIGVTESTGKNAQARENSFIT